MSEWNLLCDAEDINVNDRIVVECEDGSTQVMRYVGTEKGKYIKLRDNSLDIIYFSVEDLGEIEGDRMVLGKYER